MITMEKKWETKQNKTQSKLPQIYLNLEVWQRRIDTHTLGHTSSDCHLWGSAGVKAPTARRPAAALGQNLALWSLPDLNGIPQGQELEMFCLKMRSAFASRTSACFLHRALPDIRAWNWDPFALKEMGDLTVAFQCLKGASTQDSDFLNGLIVVVQGVMVLN